MHFVNYGFASKGFSFHKNYLKELHLFYKIHLYIFSTHKYF